MARIDLKKTTITLRDGTPSTPNELDLHIGVGNITYDVTKQFVYVTNRGLLDTVRKGDQVPVDVKFEATFDTYEVRAASAPTVSVADFLKQQGNASAFITTGADACEPYSVDIIITQDQDCAGVETEVITLTEFRYEKGTFNVKTGQISFTGKCKIITPTILRV